jgi:hypothetical protein
MNEWLNKTDTEPEKYHVPLNQTTYPADIKNFWANEAPTEKQRQERYWRIRDQIEELWSTRKIEVEKAEAAVRARIKAKEGADPEHKMSEDDINREAWQAGEVAAAEVGARFRALAKADPDLKTLSPNATIV